MEQTDPDAEASVRAELIRRLYRHSPTTLTGLLAAGVLLAVTLWETAPHTHLMAWLLSLVLVVSARFALGAAFFRRNPGPDSIAAWGYLFASSGLAFGLVWGASALLFVPGGAIPNLVMVSVILLAIAAGSVIALSSYPLALTLYLVSSMSGLLTALWLRGDTLSWPLFAVTLIALLSFGRHGWIAHTTLLRALRIDYENLALRHEAEEKSALLEATLENISQGISLVDRNGRLRMSNRQFFRLLDIPADRSYAALTEALAAARPPLKLQPAALQEYHREDQAMIEITQNDMPDGGRVQTYTDITNRVRREQALELARRSAEQASAAKTRFLAAASHDLRQPIHALGLLFDALAMRVRSAETEPLIGRVNEAIEAVDTTLTTLLDVSKLDAGVLTPTLGPISVTNLFRRLESELSTLAREKGNRLDMRPCRFWVRSDLGMLERMLRNLIANALRYTARGRVLVAARRRGAMLRFEVYDSGIGIPADKLDEIFVEFQQLGNPQRDRSKGLGLGLAIVKRLSELLSHPVEVHSRLGRGSRFSILVPLTASPSVPATSSPSIAPAGPFPSAKTVLVLDDDRVVLESMSILLRQWGLRVLPAETVDAALVQARAQPPDLLVVDYRLPGHISGLEAIAMVKEVLGTSVPALMVTGDTGPDRLREAKASGYPLLHKPVRPATLRSTVQQLLPSP
jgi:signal transduction histidine kinase